MYALLVNVCSALLGGALVYAFLTRTRVGRDILGGLTVAWRLLYKLIMFGSTGKARRLREQRVARLAELDRDLAFWRARAGDDSAEGVAAAEMVAYLTPQQEELRRLTTPPPMPTPPSGFATPRAGSWPMSRVASADEIDRSMIKPSPRLRDTPELSAKQQEAIYQAINQAATTWRADRVTDTHRYFAGTLEHGTSHRPESSIRYFRKDRDA